MTNQYVVMFKHNSLRSRWDHSVWDTFLKEPSATIMQHSPANSASDTVTNIDLCKPNTTQLG